MTRKFGHSVDHLSRTLSAEILQGAIAPGAHLSEARLAERFAVSRTPVREALGQIVASGLAERRPHLGVFVTSLPANRLFEMFELVADLEGVCARHAADRMTAREKKTFEVLYHSGYGFVREGDRPAYDALNVTFHEQIVQGSHNTYLQQATMAARTRVLPYRSAQFRWDKRLDQSHTEHGRIVRAILAGDGARAELRMRKHLDASYQASQNLLDRLFADHSEEG